MKLSKRIVPCFIILLCCFFIVPSFAFAQELHKEDIVISPPGGQTRIDKGENAQIRISNLSPDKKYILSFGPIGDQTTTAITSQIDFSASGGCKIDSENKSGLIHVKNCDVATKTLTILLDTNILDTPSIQATSDPNNGSLYYTYSFSIYDTNASIEVDDNLFNVYLATSEQPSVPKNNVDVSVYQIGEDGTIGTSKVSEIYEGIKLHVVASGCPVDKRVYYLNSNSSSCTTNPDGCKNIGGSKWAAWNEGTRADSQSVSTRDFTLSTKNSGNTYMIASCENDDYGYTSLTVKPVGQEDIQILQPIATDTSFSVTLSGLESDGICYFVKIKDTTKGNEKKGFARTDNTKYPGFSFSSTDFPKSCDDEVADMHDDANAKDQMFYSFKNEKGSPNDGIITIDSGLPEGAYDFELWSVKPACQGFTVIRIGCDTIPTAVSKVKKTFSVGDENACRVCGLKNSVTENFPYYSKVLNTCCRLYGCEGAEKDPETNTHDLETTPCTDYCYEGYRCAKLDPGKPPCLVFDDTTGNCTKISTGFGTDILTDPAGFVSSVLGVLLSVSGMLAVLLIIRSGYQMMTSQGNPEAIQEARERITSAIVGLLFIIFSLVVLQVIGVDILKLPGFGK